MKCKLCGVEETDNTSGVCNNCVKTYNKQNNNPPVEKLVGINYVGNGLAQQNDEDFFNKINEIIDAINKTIKK